MLCFTNITQIKQGKMEKIYKLRINGRNAVLAHDKAKDHAFLLTFPKTNTAHWEFRHNRLSIFISAYNVIHLINNRGIFSSRLQRYVEPENVNIDLLIMQLKRIKCNKNLGVGVITQKTILNNIDAFVRKYKLPNVEKIGIFK